MNDKLELHLLTPQEVESRLQAAFEVQSAPLLKLLDAMQAQIDNGDTEGAHGNADRILIELIETITPPAFLPIITEILKAYEQVEKWYA